LRFLMMLLQVYNAQVRREDGYESGVAG